MDALTSYTPSFTPIPRKRHSTRFWLTIVVAIFVSVGLLASLLLINVNQDIRQQAREIEYDSAVERATILPTPSPSATPAPAQLEDRCSVSGDSICRFGFTYRCSSPFSLYQKTNESCGAGTAKPGLLINCCIDKKTVKKELAACQEEGVVGVCPTEASVCVTAQGEIPYGESTSGICTLGVRTIFACSSTGVLTTSSTRVGCAQPITESSQETAPSFEQCDNTQYNCNQTPLTIWVQN